MRMKNVSKEELASMDKESDRCALELSDAKVDVLGYACLVAIMAAGNGYHRVSEQRLRGRLREQKHEVDVITSAGALIDALKTLKVRRVALIAPYMKPLTDLVVDYIAQEGFEVVDYRSLEIPDNLEVGLHDPGRLPGIVASMATHNADAIVISACVQMPSLHVIAQVEASIGKPVLSAAVATTYSMLKSLRLDPVVPGAGALLSGAY
jgi:maleate isomerase